MPPFMFTVVGLVFDISGAFMLAIEAIKLERFRRLRDRFLSPIALAVESPRFRRPEDTDRAIHDSPAFYARNLERGFRGHLRLYTAAHYVAGSAVGIGLYLLLAGFGVRPQEGASWLIKHWPPEAAYPIIILLVAYFLLGVLWMFGEIIHMGASLLLRSVTRFIRFIEERTPDGTIGMIGFALLLLGFVGQMTGAILSGMQ